MDNGGDFLQQEEICLILGYPGVLFFCDLSRDFVCQV